MKWLVAGMRGQFVDDFVQWLKENEIRFLEPYYTNGIFQVMYMPIGREQKEKCKKYIEYRCNNDLF